jgi:hypothetical protein
VDLASLTRLASLADFVVVSSSPTEVAAGVASTLEATWVALGATGLPFCSAASLWMMSNPMSDLSKYSWVSAGTSPWALAPVVSMKTAFFSSLSSDLSLESLTSAGALSLSDSRKLMWVMQALIASTNLTFWSYSSLAWPIFLMPTTVRGGTASGGVSSALELT